MHSQKINRTADLRCFVADCWNEIFTMVRNAVVYIDHPAAECLHWFTGDKAYLSLKDAGAVLVHELAMYNFRYTKVKDAKKAVIISTSVNPAFYQRTIKMIADKNKFESCTIVCAAAPTVMNYSTELSTDEIMDYSKMKRDIKTWMSSMDSLHECFVEIVYYPVFLAIITDQIFITPPFGNLMPSIENVLTEDLTTDLDHFVSLMDSLFTHLSLREDIYTIGNTSEYAASKLESLPGAIKRKNRLNESTNNGVSLILVDRVIDLCTATTHSSEAMLGKILCTLPRLPCHYNDVAINMSTLLHDTRAASRSTDIAGCLATKNKNLLNLLISRKQKDVLLTAHNLLMATPSCKESPKAKMMTRISAHSLEKLIHKINDVNNVDVLASSSKELQIILAIIQTLKSDKATKLELLVSFEKLILQNLAASRDSSSILVQISNIIKTRASRGLEMENLLALLMYVYALAGTEIKFSYQQELLLQHAIAHAILEDIKTLNERTTINRMTVYQQTLLLLGVTDGDLAKETTNKITTHIMNKLHATAEQRAVLHDYRSLMVRPGPQGTVRCSGLIEQLLTDILSPQKHIPSDLRHRSSAATSGFNLFRKGRTKHPMDNPWVIIYVIGGLTAEECRKAEEIISADNRNCHIMLAGSRFLNPVDVVDKVILSSLEL